jgi:mRNA-degrading endonuclease RelE of RelBE toxin-antitoxin system
VTLTVRRARGGQVVRRIRGRAYRGGVPHRVRVAVGRRFRRGDYRVQLSVTQDGRTTTETLTARRL